LNAPKFAALPFSPFLWWFELLFFGELKLKSILKNSLVVFFLLAFLIAPIPFLGKKSRQAGSAFKSFSEFDLGCDTYVGRLQRGG